MAEMRFAENAISIEQLLKVARCRQENASRGLYSIVITHCTVM